MNRAPTLRELCTYYAFKVSQLAQILAPKTPDSANTTSGLRNGAPGAPYGLSYLCGLCAFAGDIPVLLVVAIPR
jgi:hypothetical protein